MNALLKIASKKRDDDKVNKKAVVAGGLLVHMNAGKVAPRVIGYHKLYHGTGAHNVESIKKNGLDPKYGGKTGGAADLHGAENFKRNSSGKVHVTPHKGAARVMANFVDIKKANPEGGNMDAMKGAMKNSMKGKGHVFQVHMSEGQYRRTQADPDMGGARTYHQKIRKEQLQGGFKGMASVVNKGTLKRHFTTERGLKRVAHGLGNAGAAALGAKMLYDQAKKLKSKKG